MLRINDTRIYHEFGKNYLLREFTSREAKVQDIRVSNTIYIYDTIIIYIIEIRISSKLKILRVD